MKMVTFMWNNYRSEGSEYLTLVNNRVEIAKMIDIETKMRCGFIWSIFVLIYLDLVAWNLISIESKIDLLFNVYNFKLENVLSVCVCVCWLNWRNLLLLLWWCMFSKVFQSTSDGFWDWWWNWQMITLKLIKSNQLKSAL